MESRRSGFTLTEMLLVVLISAVVLAVGMQEIPRLLDPQAVGSARDAVASTSHRARAEAMRSGRPVYVWIRPGEGVVRLGRSTTELLDSVVMSDFKVSMTGSSVDLCYTARGYAMPGCTTVTASEEFTFTRHGHTATLTVLPLGQMWGD